ncbi:unnamed protein product [Clavelina lepadiformis]|uniref:Transcription initiation factor TFIID subunit 12 n=1 Tax=Clavelina lepadiformis TaxID=159417 RepID=A0ABP0G3J3_CLALP
MDISTHTLSLQQTLKGVETKLQFLGPGPHAQKQLEELQTLTKVKQTLVEQIQASIQSKSSSPASVLPQGTPLVIAKTTLAMPQATPPSAKAQPQVVLNKSRPGMPFMMTAQREANNKILNKQRLQELVKEIDPSEQLDEDVEEMLMHITDDFIESVVAASCNLAKHRKSNTLEVKDLKLHLDKHWNISVPGYGTDDIRPLKKTTSTDAHKQRLAIIRRAVKK